VTFAYILRRLLLAVPIVIGVTVVTFALLQVTSQGYVPGMEAESTTPADIERLRHSLGLDRPLYEQYLSWLWGMVRGDFGRSLLDNSPIINDILSRLPNTMYLSLTGLALGLAGAVPLGVISAVRRGSKIDNLVTLVSVAGFAVPEFWLGVMMILFFSVSFESWGLPFLPSSGSYNPVSGGDLVDRLAHLVMPASVLGFASLSVMSRYIRSSMLSVLSQDYIRTARSKGLSENKVLYTHALRNTLLPIITLVGLWLPRLVSGSLVVEVIFGWPGIGRYAFDRALRYDYTTVLAITTLISAMVVLGNILADTLYAVANPRIRYR
jgi:peptide/nickel transport system permease protein